jgi:hypothetical protein
MTVAITGGSVQERARVHYLLTGEGVTITETGSDLRVVIGVTDDLSPSDVAIATDRPSWWSAVRSAGGVVGSVGYASRCDRSRRRRLSVQSKRG